MRHLYYDDTARSAKKRVRSLADSVDGEFEVVFERMRDLQEKMEFLLDHLKLQKGLAPKEDKK